MKKKKSKKGGHLKSGPKTRKELRKEKRKEKKVKKHDFFTKKSKSKGNSRVKPGNHEQEGGKLSFSNVKSQKDPPTKAKVVKDPIKERQKREDERHKKLQEQMKRNRNAQLREANDEEDRIIKKLEKQLKLNKRKSKSVPKSFAEDGLDYLLDVCDEDKLKKVAHVEKHLQDSDSEFEEDLAAAVGKQKHENLEENEQRSDVSGGDNFADSDDFSDGSNDCSQDNLDSASDYERKKVKSSKSTKRVQFCDEVRVQSEVTDCVDFMKKKKNIKTEKRKHDNDLNVSHNSKKIKRALEEIESEEPGRFVRLPQSFTDTDSENERDSDLESEGSYIVEEEKEEKNKTWEDIYGRTRDKQGNIVQANTGAYVPPALRAQQRSVDEKDHQRLQRLRRQSNGFLNRLTESNLVSIASGIEQLYSSNSRHDMNETLTSLLLDSLVTSVLSIERLVMEHAVLIACLHSKVGSDVGAFVLQTMAKKFDSLFHQDLDVENKELDNVVLILCYLYNFKVVHGKLLLDVLHRLAGRFGPKDLELVLIILRITGFGLRKDEPAELKSLMLQLQQNAQEQAQRHNELRVKFMLDVLLAVKNNNVARLPGCDPGPVDHLRKLLRSLLTSSSTSPELNISLQDLLEADERGRWWVVGSAWAGQAPSSTEENKPKARGPTYSAELLELARRQRMNTEVRRNIFCVLMTAHDYQEAFENLLQLGLKGQQVREIVHVTVDCCLQEAKFNRYYCHVLQNFCDYERTYRMTLQYALWDKFRELGSLNRGQLQNLTHMVLHLLLQGGLTLTVFKILDVAELEKPAIRMLRQVLLGLMAADKEVGEKTVTRIKPTPRNRSFCSGLRVFLQRFVAGQAGTDNPQHDTLQEQVEYFDNLLMNL